MRIRHFRSACSLVVVVAVLLLAAAPARAQEKSRMDVVLSGGRASYGPDLKEVEIKASLLRQSSTLLAVCSK